MGANKIYMDALNNEYIYLYLPSLSSNLANLPNPFHAVFAISSKTKLDSTERNFLFKNMTHALIRPDKVTLDNMIEKPLDFTGKDALICKIQDGVQNVKDTMLENLELVLSKTESLTEIEAKALDLEKRSKDFVNNTKKMNSCCGR